MPSVASAESALKNSFVDPEYAVRAWQTLPTGEAFDREYERVNPAYEAWKKANGQPNRAALAALTGKDADLVRQGHDLDAVYKIWTGIYSVWMKRRVMNVPAEPWNQTDSAHCGLIESLNVVTGQCNDLPDWRTANDIARDDKILADYRAKQSPTN